MGARNEMLAPPDQDLALAELENPGYTASFEHGGKVIVLTPKPENTPDTERTGRRDRVGPHMAESAVGDLLNRSQSMIKI